jgi:hypothetical protein
MYIPKRHFEWGAAENFAEYTYIHTQLYMHPHTHIYIYTYRIEYKKSRWIFQRLAINVWSCTREDIVGVEKVNSVEYLKDKDGKEELGFKDRFNKNPNEFGHASCPN